jgi:hypothetical protein
VQQHQQKEKKHCTAAQFLLKVISCYPKSKTFIQAMDTGIHNLSIFDFLVYALSANPTYLPMVESKPIGISGQLVLAVAQQFHIMQPQSILHFIGDMPVTYEDIHRVLSGIMFDITDPTANSFESFQAGDNWIEGNQIEMIRALLYEDGFYTENGELKPVMITPSFYTFLCSDTFDACSWLKSCFRRLNLLIEEQLLPCECLIPANIGGNSHWILIHVDIQRQTYFPINPYHPSTPNTNDIEVGERIASCFSSYFSLQPLICEAPSIIFNLPIQEVSDTSNCGVFVILYCLAFFERPIEAKDILMKFSIQEFRLIIAAWLLTKTIPRIHHTPNPK